MDAVVNAWTFHGGQLNAARAAYPDARAPWIDLSTGINPTPWPGVDAIAIDWHALPDAQALAELEASAAEHFGVDPAHVCALPGSEMGLRLIGGSVGGRAVHVTPAYRTHGEMIAGSAAVAAMEDATNATVILANPGNPDGRLTSRAALMNSLDRLGGSPHWLIVDEAFADSAPEASIADEVADARQLIVLRSFGKFFGLAGVRLGFAVAPRETVARLRSRIGSWPLSAAALAIGTAAYRDRGWITATRTKLRRDAAALDAMLATHGLTAKGECPLFRLVETEDAHALFDRLARRAILTRPFDYDPRWLRIGLPGDVAAFDRLDAALGDG